MVATYPRGFGTDFAVGAGAGIAGGVWRNRLRYERSRVVVVDESFEGEEQATGCASRYVTREHSDNEIPLKSHLQFGTG